MKTIIIFKSKTGFTEKYAEYLGQKLSCEVIENKGLKLADISDYDTIIYGGSLYASGILGLKKLIIRNFDSLENKKIIIFAVGATPGRKDELIEITSSNFTDEQMKKVNFLYTRGGFNYKKLNVFDKVLMLMLKLKIKLKRDKSNDEKGMLNAYTQSIDFVTINNKEKLYYNIKKIIKDDTSK